MAPQDHGGHADTITASALSGLLTHANVKVVDASWYMPPLEEAQSEGAAAGGEVSTSIRDYMVERIPGAVFFDHDEVSDLNSPLPQATPSAERFAACVGALGISSGDTVVVYEGCAGYESAPRCWFLFKLFGHANVRVLEGGLPAWLAEGGRTESGLPSAVVPASYQGAAQVPGLQLDASEVFDNLRLQRVQVVDCRPPSVYLGEAKERLFNVVNHGVVQYHDQREGHVPGAKNVPFEGLIQQPKRMSSNNLAGMARSASSGQLQTSSLLLPADQLAAVFERAQIDLQQPVAAVCGTGRTSAALLFALRLMGTEAMLVKDGMAAWSAARGKSLPMTARALHDLQEPTDMPTGAAAPDGPKRVIMWAVTRSRSTAFERSVSMRRDAVVTHELLTEPFLREFNPANYIKLRGGQESEGVASTGVAYEAMLEVMLADYSLQGYPFHFSKELACYYHHPDLISDEWLLRFKHVILVRDPQAALASFYRLSQGDAKTTYFDPRESGFRESFEIFRRVTALGGDVVSPSPRPSRPHLDDPARSHKIP